MEEAAAESVYGQGYEALDWAMVWETATVQLGPLREQASRELERLGG